jgi:hypothetical protein
MWFSGCRGILFLQIPKQRELHASVIKAVGFTMGAYLKYCQPGSRQDDYSVGRLKIKRSLLPLLGLFLMFVPVSCDYASEVEPDAYTAIKPPFNYSRNESPEKIEYKFNSPNPPLRISNQVILFGSANVVLKSLRLPLVNTPGVNVEYYEYQEQPVGARRMHRTEYKWIDYELGTLIFKRTRYGSKHRTEYYDSLDKITIIKDK